MDALWRITTKGETVKQPSPSSLQAQLAITGVCSVRFRSTWSSLELITNEKFQITFSIKLKRCIFLRLIQLKTLFYFIVCTHSQLPRAQKIGHDWKEAVSPTSWIVRDFQGLPEHCSNVSSRKPQEHHLFFCFKHPLIAPAVQLGHLLRLAWWKGNACTKEYKQKPQQNIKLLIDHACRDQLKVKQLAVIEEQGSTNTAKLKL